MIARRASPAPKKPRKPHDRRAAARLGWQRRTLVEELHRQARLSRKYQLDRLPALKDMIDQARAANGGRFYFRGVRLRVRLGAVFDRVLDPKGNVIVCLGGWIFK